MNWVTELGKRGVFQALGIYVAVAWGSIEILITAADRFGWPAWLGDAALILFLTALPFVVLLSWAFDLTGSGLQRMEAGSLRGKALIALTLTVVLGLSASWFVTRESSTPAPSPGQAFGKGDGRPVIAVMPFKNLTDSDKGDLVALSFTDEVINRINAHPDLVALDLATVSNPQMAGFAGGGAGAKPPMDFTVRGTLRTAPNGIELRVRMTDGQGKVAWEYDTVVDQRDAAGLREEQKFVAGQVAAGVGSSLTGMDYCEPSANQEAVGLFYEARRRFAARGGENVATAAKLLETAIRLDPNYARAMDLLSSVYQRFAAYVLPEPEQYGMSKAELIEFLSGSPEVALAREALARCPSLGSSYVTVETSIPAPQTWADAVGIFAEALKRDPANLDIRGQLYQAYLKMGHVHDAGKIAQEMYQRDPLNPRNSANLSTVARLEGDSQKALKLIRRAQSLGYSPQDSKALAACDLLYLGDGPSLDELLGPDWQPGNLFPIDPRRVLAARTDPAVRQALIKKFGDLIENGDRVMLSNLVGYSCSLLFELGDEPLSRRAVQRLADLTGRGEMPPIFWGARYRQNWGNRLLDIEVWQDHWIDFWKRIGPPDGCTWTGERLDCEWAK